MEINKIENYEPSKEETLQAMKELAKYLSPTKVLCSPDYPDLKIRGERKVNDTKNSNTIKQQN